MLKNVKLKQSGKLLRKGVAWPKWVCVGTTAHGLYAWIKRYESQQFRIIEFVMSIRDLQKMAGGNDSNGTEIRSLCSVSFI